MRLSVIRSVKKGKSVPHLFSSFWWFVILDVPWLVLHTLIFAFISPGHSPCVCVHVKISPSYKDLGHVALVVHTNPV